MNAALGIDVGGTKIAAGVVDAVERAPSSSGGGCRRDPSRRRGGAARLRRAGRGARRRTYAGRHRPLRAGRPRRPAIERGHGGLARPRPGGRNRGPERRRRLRPAGRRVRRGALRRGRGGLAVSLRRSSARARARASSSTGAPTRADEARRFVLGAPPVEAGRERPGARPRSRSRARGGRAGRSGLCATRRRRGGGADGSVLAVLANALDPSLVVLGGGPRRARRGCGSASSGRVRHSSRTPAFRRFRSSARSSHRTEA